MPRGIYIRTKETRLKMSISALGKHHWTNEMKEKVSNANMRERNGMYGKIGYWKEKKLSKQHCGKLSISHMGYKCTEATRLKMSLAHKGEKCNFWKDGITPKNKAIRNSMKFRLWREAVFVRDNWTCQICNKRGGKLRAHHIWNFALFVYLRFNINNGVTLCKECHNLIHKR